MELTAMLIKSTHLTTPPPVEKPVGHLVVEGDEAVVCVIVDALKEAGYKIE